VRSVVRCNLIKISGMGKAAVIRWATGLLGLLLAWIGEQQLDSGLGWPAGRESGRRANKVGSSATGCGKAES
jgi:hypothetical protein